MRSTVTQHTAVEGVRTFQVPEPRPFMPEWRRRALELTEKHGRVAVVDMTGRLVVR